jgi:phosphatidylglycerophosphatase A
VPETRPEGRTRRSIAYVLATWFGCGRVPYAPGTAGTLGAIPVYLALRPLGPVAIAVAALLLTAVGIWASSIVADDCGLKDPQFVVIDEVAGVLVTLAAAPPTWHGLALGVVLFRAFDMSKPWPARLAEERLPSGWGIVMDDIAAGAWGAAVLIVVRLGRGFA